jgi:hypothetical protein
MSQNREEEEQVVRPPRQLFQRPQPVQPAPRRLIPVEFHTQMTNQQFNDQYRHQPEAPSPVSSNQSASVQQTNNEIIQNVLDLAMNRIRNSNAEYRNAVLTSAHIRVTNRALNEPSPFMPLLGF